MSEELLSTNELADILKVHKNTIYRWADEGMPRIEMTKRTIRYKLEDVMEWIEGRNEEDEHEN